jgi:serine protease
MSNSTTTTAATSYPLVYGGGPIQVNPKIYLIFWGSQWASDPLGVIPYEQKFFQGLGDTQDGWSRVMDQYCQGVSVGATDCSQGGTHVGFNGSVYAGTWVDTSSSAPYQATGNDIAAEATAAAAHFGNTTAASNVGVQYQVFSPSGTHPDGFPSSGFCAWHNNWSTQYGDISVANEPYMPEGSGGCGTNWLGGSLDGSLDGYSIVVGHEYAETVTDPKPTSGWADYSGAENGDKCSWIRSGQGAIAAIPLSTGNFAVQSTYSNQISGCDIGTPGPPPPPACTTTQLLCNPGFESGNVSWGATSDVITTPSTWGQAAHNGNYVAWLDGSTSAHVDILSQQVTIPAGTQSAVLSLWLHIFTDQTTTTQNVDSLTLWVNNDWLHTWTNLNANSGYSPWSFDLSRYAGQTVTVEFAGSQAGSTQTSFLIDDTALNVS